MRIALFVSCLVDQAWPAAGVATVEALRRAGCEVGFDPRQTCCGQPAFNSGYPKDARRVAANLVDVLDEALAGGTEAVVVPSGSCCAMVKHLPELFAGAGDPKRHQAACRVADQTHELSAFLVHTLGVESVGGVFEGKVTWHDACHGLRELKLHDEPRRLIRSVRGVQLVEMPGAAACCGFGGTFSVKHDDLSVAMLDRKLEGIAELGVEIVVSGDVSCLMQIEGRLMRQGVGVRALHLAELLVHGHGDGNGNGNGKRASP